MCLSQSSKPPVPAIRINILGLMGVMVLSACGGSEEPSAAVTFKPIKPLNPYPSVQALALQWAQDTLDLANQFYRLGQIYSIGIAKSVPPDSALYEDAQEKVRVWEREKEKNDALLKQAERALKQSRWDDAFKAASQISAHTFWKERKDKILADAIARPVLDDLQETVENKNEDAGEQGDSPTKPSETAKPSGEETDKDPEKPPSEASDSEASETTEE